MYPIENYHNPWLYEDIGDEWTGDKQSWCSMTSGERMVIFVSKWSNVGYKQGLSRVYIMIKNENDVKISLI